VLTADPNEYRGMLEDAVRAATGRAVAIGDVDLALSLTPTIVLKDVTLANVPGGSRPQMVEAERLEVQMALLPLLSGEFDAKRFVLRSADILLEADSTGAGNWNFETGEGEATAAIRLLQLGRVAIEDSTVAFRDAGTGETETFRIERLTARQAEPAAPVEVSVDSVINGQPVKFAGTLGALRLLEGSTPYPIDLSGEVAGLAASLTGEIARPLEGKGYSLRLTASGPSLAGLGAMTAADLPPGSPVDVTASVEDADGAIRFRDIAGRIGGSDVRGEAIVRPGQPNWRIEAQLAAAHLDLQDFLQPRADGAGLNDPRLFSARPLPHRWIGKIDMAARLTADEVVYGEHVLTNAGLDAVIADGRLTLTDFRFGYGGGNVAMRGSLDINAPAPVWELQTSARRLAAGEFLQRAVGFTLVGGGRADIEGALTASGRSLRELAMTAAGSLGTSIVDGRLNDDLLRLFLTDLTQAVSFDGGGARLQCLTATFAVEDGVARSRQFVADTGAAVVTGAGNISLRDETIAMRFEPAARDVSLAALAVPVDVTGPLADPAVTPDAIAATTNVAVGAASMATAGLADAVLGLVGAEPLLADTPVASCAALPAAATPAKSKTTASSKTTAPQTQEATTAAPRKKTKKKKKSTGEQLLDDAGAVLNNVGNSIGDFLEDSTSPRNSRKPQGNKQK
jgi:hypothetical protein